MPPIPPWEGQNKSTVPKLCVCVTWYKTQGWENFLVPGASFLQFSACWTPLSDAPLLHTCCNTSAWWVAKSQWKKTLNRHGSDFSLIPTTVSFRVKSPHLLHNRIRKPSGTTNLFFPTLAIWTFNHPSIIHAGEFTVSSAEPTDNVNTTYLPPPTYQYTIDLCCLVTPLQLPCIDLKYFPSNWYWVHKYRAKFHQPKNSPREEIHHGWYNSYVVLEKD